MKGLLKAWVARSAECRLEQKAGYGQHTSPFSSTPTILNVLIAMKNNNKSDYIIRFTDKALTYISKHADLNNPEAIKTIMCAKSQPT